MQENVFSFILKNYIIFNLGFFFQRATKPSKMKLTRDTSEEVKTMRQFIDPKTEDPLLLSDISKFMEFGGTKIKFTSDEVRATQKSLLWGSFGLKLICFKQQSQLKYGFFKKLCL